MFVFSLARPGVAPLQTGDLINAGAPALEWKLNGCDGKSEERARLPLRPRVFTPELPSLDFHLDAQTWRYESFFFLFFRLLLPTLNELRHFRSEQDGPGKPTESKDSLFSS